MIESFIQNWPTEVDLLVYAEDCEVEEVAPNLQVFNLHQASPELVLFKQQWKDIPKANGDVTDDPIRSLRKDAGKGFKWDAVRFAHKVYAIFAANTQSTHWLIWMDADTICHSPITHNQLCELCPDNKDICFLGRKNKYTECGLYAMNLQSENVIMFLKEFQQVYDHAETGIFTMAEWHDSYVFDVVRKKVPMIELDWSSHLINGEGHPLINSDWGQYLDHLKGDRKHAGHSKLKDLKVIRTESYWQKLGHA